jgi:hypothetical protein
VKGTNGTFSFRIVAKRKDIEGRRFDLVKLPSAPKPGDMPHIMKPAELPDVTRGQVAPAADERPDERP